MDNVTMIRNNQRGQAFAIGAIVVAISLVVLIVILNSVLFTGNFGADSPTKETQSAQEIQHSIHQQYGQVILGTNDGDTNNIQNDFEDNIEITNQAINQQSITNDASILDINMDSVSVDEEGTIYRDTDPDREFTSPEYEYTDEDGNTVTDENDDWYIVEESDNVRRFIFAFEEGDIDDTDFNVFVNGEEEISNGQIIGINPDTEDFSLNIQDNVNEIQIEYNDNVDSDSGTITIDEDDYWENNDQLLVDVTTGEVAGEKDEFDFPDPNNDSGVDELSIRFQDGDTISGQYVLVDEGANEENIGQIEDENTSGDHEFGDDENDQPYTEPGIYEATVSYQLETIDTVVEITDLRLAPCEPSDDSCFGQAHPNPEATDDGSNGDNGDNGEGNPTINELEAESNNTGGGDWVVAVDWEVEETGGSELDEVEIEVTGDVNDSRTIDVSGNNQASGDEIFDSTENNPDADVTLTVTTADGESTTDTRST